MALVTKRVYIDTTKLPTSKIPSGHGVQTSEASLNNVDITETYTWTLAASDSVAATAVAGFNDLLNTELIADIDAFIAANTGLGVDISTHSVSYNAKVTDISYGSGTDIYLTSTLVSFNVTFQLRVYVSA